MTKTKFYIPVGEAALCAECAVIFSVRERACPRCQTEDGWMLAPFKSENIEATESPVASEKGETNE